MSVDIAIIGAGGFVGSRLAEALVLDGKRSVRAIVRGYRNMAALCRFGPAIDIRLANAESSTALREALADARTAVNLTTGPPAGIIRSTSAIYEACMHAGVSRLVHLSSAVVYGDVSGPTPDDAPPLSEHWMPYARAKAHSELWLRDRLAGPVDVVVLRPGIVWGVRSPHTTAFAQSLRDKNTFLVDEGRGIFNGIYIDNLVAAIRAGSAAPNPAGGFYHVADAETVTWREFLGQLGAPLGCDVSRLANVSGTRFPRSARSTIEDIQSLTLVNALYHRTKAHWPEGFKSAIKGYLEGSYGYDRHPTSYAAKPGVNREGWHLQRSRHKLAATKFEQKFGLRPPVSFSEGMRKTHLWLETVGWIDASAPL